MYGVGTLNCLSLYTMIVFVFYFRSFMQLWMYMAWQMSSPYQALQLVCITLPSVFLKSSFLVSQVKTFYWFWLKNKSRLAIRTVLNSWFCFHIVLVCFHQSLVSNKYFSCCFLNRCFFCRSVDEWRITTVSSSRDWGERKYKPWPSAGCVHCSSVSYLS